MRALISDLQVQVTCKLLPAYRCLLLSCAVVCERVSLVHRSGMSLVRISQWNREKKEVRLELIVSAGCHPQQDAYRRRRRRFADETEVWSRQEERREARGAEEERSRVLNVDEMFSRYCRTCSSAIAGSLVGIAGSDADFLACHSSFSGLAD